MSRVKKLATSPLDLRHYEHLFLFSMSTLQVTFVTVVLIFAKYLLYLHIFTCTYRDAYTQAHMYNQHTRGITTAVHRDLDERGRKTLLETSRTHIHTKKKN